MSLFGREAAGRRHIDGLDALRTLAIVGVTLILLSKTKLGSFMEIPYGPYICMGCLSWMFFGPELVRWYLDLVGF